VNSVRMRRMQDVQLVRVYYSRICGVLHRQHCGIGASCVRILHGLFVFFQFPCHHTLCRYGVRNSLLLAPMPTASTAQILGNNESIEPYTSNIYTRRVLSGEFQVCMFIRDILNSIYLLFADCQPALIERLG
jgi:hypothetical protein